MLHGIIPHMLGPVGGGVLRPQDVFATALYTGNATSQTINTGVDLAGFGGLVWAKGRDYSGDRHSLMDTIRGGQMLASNLADAQVPYANAITDFGSSGFSLGNNTFVNRSAINFASWSFRRAPKFFDVVTWAGDGATTRSISHSLGIAPGLIIVKRTSSSGNWLVYHRSLGAYFSNNSYNLILNTNAARDSASYVLTDSLTGTSFTIADGGINTNTSGETYVAYLFAHDPDPSGIVQCGVANGGAAISLGWRPQYVLLKASTLTDGWAVVDSARGMGSSPDPMLRPNTSNGEDPGNNFVDLSSTGFTIASVYYGTTNPVIYLAIREPIL